MFSNRESPVAMGLQCILQDKLHTYWPLSPKSFVLKPRFFIQFLGRNVFFVHCKNNLIYFGEMFNYKIREKTHRSLCVTFTLLKMIYAKCPQ